MRRHARAWLSIRALRLLPTTFFATLTLFVFRTALFPRQFSPNEKDVIVSSSMGDVINEFLPMRIFGFDQLRHGNFPLWNPYIFAGAPYFAGFQSALLYPLNVLHLLMPATTAINWLVAAHVLIAALTMFAWVRTRGASVMAGVLAGVLFMFSGPVFLRVYAGHLSHLYVLVWTPLILISIDRLSSSGRWTWCLLGAAAIALQILGGSPQFVYYTSLVVILYAGLTWIHSPSRGRLIVGVSAIFLIASLMSAVQLLAGVQALGESVRSGGTGFEFASSFPLPPENVLTLILPNLFGSVWHDLPTGTLDYFGRSYLWETSMFIGVTGMTLASFAAIVHWHRNAAAVAMIGITLALALGRHLPLYKLLFEHLPLYGSFRATSKFVYLTIVFLCPLAADGLDLLVSRRHRTGASRAAIVSGVTAVLLAYGIVAVDQPRSVFRSIWIDEVRSTLASKDNLTPSDQAHAADFETLTVQNLQEVLTAAVISLAAAAVLLAASRVWPRAALGFVALATLEMVAFAEANYVTTVARRPYPPAWRAAIQNKPADDRVLCYDLPPGADITYLDWGMARAASQLWGYDPGVLKRYAQTLAVSQGLPASAAGQYLEVRRTTPGLLKMLRCKLGLTLKDEEGVVIQYPQPLAVAQLISLYSVIPDRDAMLARATAPDFDPSRTVLLESKPSVEPGTGSALDTAAVVACSTDWLQIRATVTRPGLLLVTNNYSTGWHAMPVGAGGPQAKYDVMPADSTLMAIPLVAGRHDLRLEYKPLAYVIGRDVSLVSLSIFLVACGVFICYRPSPAS